MKVAVEKNGLALMYASEFLRHDPDILTAAVNQNRMALRYHTMIGNLDPYLRADPFISDFSSSTCRSPFTSRTTSSPTRFFRTTTRCEKKRVRVYVSKE